MMLRDFKGGKYLVLKQYSENYLNIGIFQDIYKKEFGSSITYSDQVWCSGQVERLSCYCGVVHTQSVRGLTPGSGGNVPMSYL